MNEELIRDIVDLQANKQVKQLTADLETNNKALQDNIVAAKQLNDILSQSKGFNEYNKNAAASTKQAEALAKLTAQRQLAEERLASFQAAESAKAQARADKEAANLKKIEDANNKAAEAARKRAAIVSASTQSDLSSSSSTGGNNTGTTVNPTNLADASAANAATAAYIQNTDAVEKNTLSKKQLALIEAQNKELARQNALALRNQAKELNAAKGSLDQRRAALTRLRATFDSLNEAERASPFGQRLAKTIPQLNEQVLTLEKSTGRAQRNVGNYTSAFASGANKAFSALKTVANILPGVGLAGLIGFAVEPIINYISALDLFKTKLTDAKVAQQDIAKALAGGEYAKAVTNVNELRINIDAAKKGFLDKKDVLKQYNETIGKTTGEVKTLDEAERELNKNAAAFIQFTLLKAAAQIALEESAKKSYEAEITRRKKLEEFSSNFLDASVSNVRSESQFRTNQQNIINQRKARQAAEVKISQDSANQQLSIAQKFQEDALKIAKSNGFDNPLGLSEDKVKKAKDNSKELEDIARKNAAALIQIQIDALKESADYFKRNADNQNFSLDARLDGLKNFSDDSLKIAKLEGDKEKAAKKLTANEILSVDAEVARKQAKIKEDSGERALEIERQNRKRISDAIAEQNEKDLTDTERIRDIELASLTDALNKSLISQDEFDKKRLKIENDYTEFYIGLQIKQTEAFIAQQKIRGENTESAEAKLAALKLKYLDITTKRQKEANAELDKEADELAEKEIERQAKLKELAFAVFDLGVNIGNAVFTRRQNQIQEEIDLNDKKRNREIENINDSTASEEEKADKIAIINARADAQNRVLEQRQREERVKQAKFEKAAAIARIIAETAIQVAKYGFFTPLGILAASLGAVSIATILATPIPKYKDGKSKGNKYSGAAWVGDGGMSELIIEPDGRMFVTPNKPTLTTVGKDTQVISGPEFKRMVAKPNTAVTNNSTNQMIDISALVAEQKAATKAFKNQKATVQFTTDKGHRYMKMKIDSVNAHIKRNFGR